MNHIQELEKQLSLKYIKEIAYECNTDIFLIPSSYVRKYCDKIKSILSGTEMYNPKIWKYSYDYYLLNDVLHFVQ